MKFYFSRAFFGLMLGSTFLAAACGAVNSSARSVSAKSDNANEVSKQPAEVVTDLKEKQTAVFAGGCFWGVDAVFKHVKGVGEVTSGYAGGTATTQAIDYETVSSGETGNAESVKVIYDPSQISYEQLLKVFFLVAHDPTTLNRQGPDTGTQYRSAIFYTTEAQKTAAEKYVAELTAAKTFAQPIVTQIAPLNKFYKAEDYHQNYLANHPTDSYIVYNDLPKLENLQKQFPDLYIAKQAK